MNTGHGHAAKSPNLFGTTPLIRAAEAHERTD